MKSMMLPVRNSNIKRWCLTVLAALAFMTLDAAVVTLRNGKTVKGEIIVHNDEVVILRDAGGARFQYPASEVQSISDGENASKEVTSEPQQTAKPQGRKVSLLVGVTGGGAFIPQEKSGGYVGGEFLIGSHHIGTKSVFIGGGLGVHAMFLGGKTYTFLPLQAAVNVPLMESKHAPFIGAALGYGFGVGGGAKGGIYTAAQVGYKYTINNRSSLLLSLRAQFQQAKIDATDVITDDNGILTPYLTKAGRSFVTCGVYMGITF